MPRKGWWREATQPMRGEDPETQYAKLHWGIQPRRRQVLDVPGMRVRQDVVQLGLLRALLLAANGGEISVVVKPRRPYPRLVVGAVDNRLYIANHHGLRLGREFSGAQILRVDYDASKGEDKGVYWFHDHEPEFPWIRMLAGGLPQYAGGSYVVAPEGIVG